MPRYIDADALRKEFSERPPDYYSTGYILDTIDELPALSTDEVRGVGEWTSVEERLPEKHVEVLICTEDYGKNELGFANTAAWDGSEWIETWNRKESIPYVSHWMPLPVPPKEDAK